MGESLVTTKVWCLFGSFFGFLLFCLKMKLLKLKMLGDPFSDGTRKILPKDLWRQSAMAKKKHESVGSNKQLNVRVRVTI